MQIRPRIRRAANKKTTFRSGAGGAGNLREQLANFLVPSAEQLGPREGLYV